MIGRAGLALVVVAIVSFMEEIHAVQFEQTVSGLTSWMFYGGLGIFIFLGDD